MLILKVGGSVFAPKHNDSFDNDYLSSLYQKLNQIYKGQIILIHGTGNVGHGFVEKYGISSEVIDTFIEVRNKFFQEMNQMFKGFKRIPAREIVTKSDYHMSEGKNIIVGGDINEKSLEIISSDDVFAQIIQDNSNAKGIILTDVDGVLGYEGEVINDLKLSDIEKIKFWNKKGDVTDGMKGKLYALKGITNNRKKGIWIINGFDLDNMECIIETGAGKGTLISK